MTQAQSAPRASVNRGRIVSPKPPLKPKHIWAIRTRLHHDGRVRDLAIFNVAIDSKLRGCDLVKLRVADIYLGDSMPASRDRHATEDRTARPIRADRADPRGSVGLA